MSRLALLVALGATLAAGAASAVEPTRQDPASLDPPAVTVLQRRLTEAGCYKGPLDGQASAETKRAVDACPDQRPVLRIETGMHLGPVRTIGVDAKCRLLASGSPDKTVRLWSLPDGRPLRVIRWPIGAGAQGEVNGVALSPDGRLVAVGGWTAQSVGPIAHRLSVFDAASGAFVTHVGAVGKPIIRVAFSADGKWLAFSSLGEGVRLVDTATWREAGADTAAGGDIYGLTFGPDALYTTSLDGTLRRYSLAPSFVKTGETKLRGGKQALSVAVDPEGKRLAVGYFDNVAIDFHDAATLAYRGRADTRAFRDGDFGALAWSADGQALLGGGLFGHGDTNETLLFGRDGKRLAPPTPVATNRIDVLVPCGSGFAFGTSDPSLGLLDAQGKIVVSHGGVAADMRRKLDGLLAMPDGKTVRFGLGRHDKNPVAFDLAKGTLKKSLVASVPYGSALTGNLPVKNWDSSFKPTFAGRPIPLDQNELSRALAVNHTPTGFVLGTSIALRAYDEKGTLRWKKSAPGEAWGVIFSAEDEVVIAAYTDGTIRWHRWSDGAELLALFVNKETLAWVAWTPSGYYSASPGAEDMIGRQINRGWTQAADFFPASTFRATYARPDVVERMIDTLDEATALQQANTARPDGGRYVAKPPAPVTEALPPVITIASPTDGAAVGERVTIDYVLRSPSGVPIQSVQALVDGRPTSGTRGLSRASDLDPLNTCLSHVEEARQGCRGRLTLDVPPGRSEIGLVATAGGRASPAARVRINRGDAPVPIAALKPKLYALVVGISAYRNKDYTLAFPAKDARGFAAALANQKGGLYSDVQVRTIADGDATAKAIREGLDWLTKQVTSRDVGLVYLAGHGLLDERNRFYFLAADSEREALRATAVPREDIADALDSVPGKALLFLDACHAGAMAGASGRRDTVDINAVVNDFAHSESGVVVFAASTGRQVSQENDSWGNGAFTKALIEGLGRPGVKARADFSHTGAITTSELDAYITERVKSLTHGAQSPVMIRPATVPDFPLAVAR